MRMAAYIRYLESVVQSLLVQHGDADIPKFDEPGITYAVCNIKEALQRHQEISRFAEKVQDQIPRIS